MAAGPRCLSTCNVDCSMQVDECFLFLFFIFSSFCPLPPPFPSFFQHDLITAGPNRAASETWTLSKPEASSETQTVALCRWREGTSLLGTTNGFIWLDKPANRRIDWGCGWLQVDRQTSLSCIGRHPLTTKKQKTSDVSKSAAAIQSKREKNSKIHAVDSHSPNRAVPK